MKYQERITQLTIVPENEPLFHECATTITLEDESGGEYVAVNQTTLNEKDGIRIDPAEWPVIRSAIDKMIAACKDKPDNQ